MIYEGIILNDLYQILSKVGSGGTGDVYLAYHLRLRKYVVVKKIKDNFVGHVNVRTEVDILKNLKHFHKILLSSGRVYCRRRLLRWGVQ